MKYIPNAMKFGNQSKSSSLITRIIRNTRITRITRMMFENANVDPKLKSLIDLVSKLQWARFNIRTHN